MSAPAVALTIAGSDSCAGAGLQADLKAFGACGVYGLTVVTSVVAERPGAVLSVEPLSAQSIHEQLAAVLPHYPVSAIKTGLLPSAETIGAVREALRGHPAPLVIDPVAIASTGTRLAAADAQDAMISLIQERATLLTPNRTEAEHFLGTAITSDQDVQDAMRALQRLFGCAVLLKGGHFQGPDAVDWLLPASDQPIEEIRAQRLPHGDIHGTGCAYSAAITARLALGLPLLDAVHGAKVYLQDAMARHSRWPSPEGPPIKALAHTAEA